MVAEVLCACGCGEPTRIAKQTDPRYGWVKGESRQFRQGHQMRLKPTTTGYPEVHNGGQRMKVHRLRAARALGKPLPRRVVVHHVDGSKSAESQLVICQDRGYHKLLHFRMRVIARGGDPNADKICPGCDALLPRSAFHRNLTHADGLQARCRNCCSAYQKTRLPRSRGER